MLDYDTENCSMRQSDPIRIHNPNKPKFLENETRTNGKAECVDWRVVSERVKVSVYAGWPAY